MLSRIVLMATLAAAQPVGAAATPATAPMALSLPVPPVATAQPVMPVATVARAHRAVRVTPLSLETAGCRTLRQMGVAEIHRGTPITSSTRVGHATFTLPANAAQGPVTWYLLRLHVRVALAADTSAGSVIVSAATNGRTAAQIELKPSGPGMEWSTVSAAEPARRERVAGRTAEISLTNFLQKTGVQGGANTLTFHVEVFDGATVASVRIFDDSCLETTTRTPETLEVRTRHHPTQIRAGGTFSVQVRVRNAGTTPVGQVSVTMVPDDQAIEPVNGTDLTIRDLTGEWAGELRFRARSPGERNIRVNVGTAISPYVGGGTVAVRVAEPGQMRWTWLFSLGLVVVVVAFVAMPLAARTAARHRSSRRPDTRRP